MGVSSLQEQLVEPILTHLFPHGLQSIGEPSQKKQRVNQSDAAVKSIGGTKVRPQPHSSFTPSYA